MPEGKAVYSVLIVSGSVSGGDYLQGLLPPAQYTPIVIVPSAGDAKRLLTTQAFDLVLINTPLTDEFGAQFATDTAENLNMGVLLLVKSEYYEQITYKVEDYGVLTVQKPSNRQTILQSIKLLTATRARLGAMEKKTEGLKAKIDEIRIVNRAKWVLIEHLKMDETAAHRYIEKQAMDMRVTKREIAEGIINTYES